MPARRVNIDAISLFVRRPTTRSSAPHCCGPSGEERRSVENFAAASKSMPCLARFDGSCRSSHSNPRDGSRTVDTFGHAVSSSVTEDASRNYPHGGSITDDLSSLRACIYDRIVDCQSCRYSLGSMMRRRPVNSREKPDNLRILRWRSLYPWSVGKPCSRDSRTAQLSHMRFTPQFLDELRARLPVSEVVGRRVKLKKAGREWKGLSPFQQEKSPSFTVNDQKGFYHDFSSGKHGDIISLPDGDRRRRLHRSRRAAGLDGRRAAAGGDARCRAARAAPQDAVRRDGTGREILRRHAGLAQRRQGARLSRRPRDFAGDAVAVPHRLCARRTLCAEGASRRARHSGRGHGGSRTPGRRRRHPGAL